jgi:hypothetical protein
MKFAKSPGKIRRNLLFKLANSLLEIHRPPMLFLIDRPNAMLSGCRA